MKMNALVFFIAIPMVKATSKVSFSIDQIGDSLILICNTTDILQGVYFAMDNSNKGECLPGRGGLCKTTIRGYVTPTQQDTLTYMEITECNEQRDIGFWTCTYGSMTSNTVIQTACISPPSFQEKTLVGLVIVAVHLVAATVVFYWVYRYTCERRKNNPGHSRNDVSATDIPLDYIKDRHSQAEINSGKKS